MAWEQQESRAKELRFHRLLLLLTAAIYFAWWVLLHFCFPQYYNPLSTRLLVVGYCLGIWAWSFCQDWARRHLSVLLGAGLWLLTAHFYFLFYRNAGDSNWIVGAFIAVIAVSYFFNTRRSLLAYSLFSAGLSILVAVLLPGLDHTVFLPGIATVLLQANIGTRSRLNALSALHESNERFSLLFNSTFEGVLVHENLRIVIVNDALLQMLNSTREALIGQDVLSILHPDDREEAFRRFQAGDSSPYESRGLLANGETRAVEVRARNFARGNQAVRLVTIQAIGDRKRMQQERAHAEALAENLRMRDEFLSVASHELKTPLTSLKLRVQVLERDLGKHEGETFPKPRLLDFLRMMNKQVNRLTMLVETMLDVSRISEGRLQIQRQRLNLGELVTEAANLFRNQCEAQQVPLEVMVQPVFVEGDPSRLSQVIENLLTNALKYGNGKPIRVTVDAQGASARLRVQDRGLGIAPDSLGRIFDRFERAISSKNISGLGLGLFITREIVQAHHGRIEVESAVNEGSTFTVWLPLA